MVVCSLDLVNWIILDAHRFGKKLQVLSKFLLSPVPALRPPPSPSHQGLTPKAHKKNSPAGVWTHVRCPGQVTHLELWITFTMTKKEENRLLNKWQASVIHKNLDFQKDQVGLGFLFLEGPRPKELDNTIQLHSIGWSVPILNLKSPFHHKSQIFNCAELYEVA